MESNEKECPFCAETIKAKAKICRFCQRELPTDLSAKEDSKPSVESKLLLEADESKKAEELVVELQALAHQCGIEFDGERYRFREHKYDKLSDALNYARRQCPQDYNWNALDKQLAAAEAKSSARTENEPAALPNLKSEVQTKTGNNSLQLIVSAVFALGMLWYFVGGGLSHGVANNFVEQYKIARQSGNPIDACVHAGIVAAAYLQAHDQTNYETWKRTERSDCSAAGLSH